MADDFVCEENIFFFRTATDVVNHEWVPRPNEIEADHADVIQTARQAPCHNITGLERAADGFSSPLEELHEIGHPAMIDVRVRTGQSPQTWIPAECADHIFVNVALQIDPDHAIRADHNIRTHPSADRKIASRISHRNVGRVIDNRDSDLSFGSLRYLNAGWRRPLPDDRTGEKDDQRHDDPPVDDEHNAG